MIDNKMLAKGHSKALFEHNLHKYDKYRIPVIHKYLRHNKNDIILDYGCGSGELIQLLYKYGYQSEGYDPSSEAVQTAGRVLKDIKFYTEIDQINRLYDAITCFQVIYCSNDKSKLLDSMVDLLIPNGILFLGITNHHALYYFLRRNFIPKKDSHIPHHPRLKLIAFEKGVPDYLMNTTTSMIQSIKWIIYFIENILTFFGFRVAQHYIYIYEKIK